MIYPARLVVLISGVGSNLQAILDAAHGHKLPAQVVAVVSNKPEAYGLVRARAAGVPAIVHPCPKDRPRADYDRDLADMVSAYHPDWVVLSGWMRLLTCTFLQRFPRRVINLHPALPGMFPGTHAVERAYQAFQNGHIDHTGVMIHLVPDEGVDNGPLLAKHVVPIFPADTLETLETRIHSIESKLLVATLRKLILSDQVERIPDYA